MVDIAPAQALTRPGQANNVGGSLTADNALFLKLFGGEVLTAFEQETPLHSRFRTRRISGGKSATFPNLGRASATYHQIGDNIITDEDAGAANYLKSIAVNERVINIDRTLIAPTMISSYEELINHWDVRGPVATELGRALRTQMDKHVYRTLVGAARTATNITGLPGGTSGGGSFTNANFRVIGGVAALITAAFAAAQKFDENSIPKEGRMFLCTPEQYYSLAQQKDLVDRDYSDGNGSYAKATVLKIADFEIVPTIMGASIDESAINPFTDPGVANDLFGANTGYGGNFATHAGMFVQQQAIGTVMLRDLMVESEYKIEYQATLLLAKYMAGHGVLRPECTIELKTA